MALLSFIEAHKASQQPSVAQTPQPQPAPQQTAQPSIANLPDSVKAQAVEAGRPTADLMKQPTSPEPPKPPAPINSGPARGRSLGMER